uniref:Uncharacterized protein n=1 Tax=viral metagenome TaxID=1070528 RepID=A0A6C0C4B4_9ZZZZ
MEPQIIDFYNEFPHSINVIEKMNEELSEIQDDNNQLREKLNEYTDPIVIYEDEQEFIRVKENACSDFHDELHKIGLTPRFIHPRLMYIIGDLLDKLLKNNRKNIITNKWIFAKSHEFQSLVEAMVEPMIVRCILSYNLIFDIIINYINKMFEPEECYGIVKFRCVKCRGLDDYLED